MLCVPSFGDVVQFVDGVGSLVKGGVKLGGKIAKGAKAVKELEKGARLTELAKTFVAGAKDSSELNSAASKAAKVAKLRIVREAEEAKKVEKAASAAEKFRSELDVLKQRAREVPRTLTDDEIRACEAVKLQMKNTNAAEKVAKKVETAAKTEVVVKRVNNGEHGIKILFRGEKASVVPDDVFQNGFIPKGTHNNALLHTKSNSTVGNFVSTSGDKSIATEFAGKNGYVYVIQTDNYVDINSTYGLGTYFPEQMEFSIPGGIRPTEIIGVYKKQSGKIMEDFIPNPNFGGK